MVERRSVWLLLSLTIVAALLGCSSPRAGLQSAEPSQSPSNAVASESPTPTADPRGVPAPPKDQQHLALADHAAHTYLYINMDRESAYVGYFVFAVEGAGLYWGDGPADVASRPDGSAEVRYDRRGWHDAAGTFDPLLWRSESDGDRSPVSLRLHGVIGADRTTASVRLQADGQSFELEDVPPIAGADEAMAGIAALVEAEDWRSLYARIHRSMRDSFDEATFVSEMTNGVLAYGNITSATVTSPAKVTDSGLGWDVATAGLDITFIRNGRTDTYPVTVALMADAEAWWLSGISQITPDASPLTSASGAP